MSIPPLIVTSSQTLPARAELLYNRSMSNETGEILKAALSLPVEARAALAGSLLESLDTDVDEAAEEEWRSVIRRRLADLDTGRVKTVPWQQVQASLNRQTRS